MQDHVSEAREPEGSVRYWVLAQLYFVRASYLFSAAESALKDGAGEIRLMARAILFPDDDEFLSECRTRLADPNFETSWTVLRMLRAIPLLGPPSRRSVLPMAKLVASTANEDRLLREIRILALARKYTVGMMTAYFLNRGRWGRGVRGEGARLPATMS